MLSFSPVNNARLIFFRISIYMSTLVYLHTPGISYVGATVEQLLERGTQHLAAGHLNDALSLYSQAVEEDPKNHLTYFRRGTAYMAMGNVRLALSDFEEALKLNKMFAPAIMQRGNVHLKIGNLKEAKEDFKLLSKSYDDDESREKLILIENLETDLEQARDLYDGGQLKEALYILDRMIDMMPFTHQLREMRAQCYRELGDVQKGILEMKYAVRLLNDNREGLLSLAQLMYETGLAVQAIEEIRECLRLDQDYTACKELYRTLKKLTAAILKAQSSLEASAFSDCVTSANEILKLEPSNMEYQNQAKVLLCQCLARSHSGDALTYCKEVAKQNPQNLDYQCDLAESYINAEQYDKAIEVCQSILESERQHRRARELIKKAQNLLRSSKRPDYYKILGVSRSAKKEDISRAYRKLAKVWHPDRYDGDKKEEAQAKFMQISSAKEVLMDDEMRARYDNGEDPLDPNQQQGHQYSNPFGPFGGFTFGNTRFEFHFG